MSGAVSEIGKKVIPLCGKCLMGKNKLINVIYYHDIVASGGNSFMTMDKKLFAEQMEYLLQEGFETMTFSDLDDEENLSFRENRVLITFDDGWKSNYTEVFPYMQEKGLKFNVFLAGGLMGGEKYLTWRMIYEMSRSGICGFGAHTYDHVDVTRMSKGDIFRQFDSTNGHIADYTGRYPTDFCFPYGNYDQASLKLLKDYGRYNRIYTSSLMYSYRDGDMCIFGRNGISNDEGMSIFRSKVKGLYNVYKTIRK